MAAQFSHSSLQAAHSASLDFYAPPLGHSIVTLSPNKALASCPGNNIATLLILASREPILPNATQTSQANLGCPPADRVFDSLTHRTVALAARDVSAFGKLFVAGLPVYQPKVLKSLFLAFGV